MLLSWCLVKLKSILMQSTEFARLWYLILEATTLSFWCFSCLYLQLLALFFPLKRLLEYFSHTNGQKILIQRSFVFIHISNIPTPYFVFHNLQMCSDLSAQDSFSQCIWILSQNTMHRLAHVNKNCAWLWGEIAWSTQFGPQENELKCQLSNMMHEMAF